MPEFDELVRGVANKSQDKKSYWRGIKCFANTGKYEDNTEIWPTKFVALPRVGDYVRSKSGRRLVIISITHGFGAVEVELGSRDTVNPTN